MGSVNDNVFTTYQARRRAIGISLKLIKMLLKKHGEQERTWSRVGDLTYVVDRLQEIINFLNPGQTNQITAGGNSGNIATVGSEGPQSAGK